MNGSRECWFFQRKSYFILGHTVEVTCSDPVPPIGLRKVVHASTRIACPRIQIGDQAWQELLIIRNETEGGSD
jgi:hypothetical protein